MAGFTYKSYQFVDKSPMIDIIRTVIQESGETLKQISEDSGVSTHTIAKWLYGDTKRPTEPAMQAVLRALGYKLEVVSYNFVPIVKPTFLKQAKTFKVVK